MQKTTFAVIDPCFFIPRFAYSDEDIPSNTSNSPFRCSRNVTDTITLNFPTFKISTENRQIVLQGLRFTWKVLLWFHNKKRYSFITKYNIEILSDNLNTYLAST